MRGLHATFRRFAPLGRRRQAGTLPGTGPRGRFNGIARSLFQPSGVVPARINQERWRGKNWDDMRKGINCCGSYSRVFCCVVSDSTGSFLASASDLSYANADRTDDIRPAGPRPGVCRYATGRGSLRCSAPARNGSHPTHRPAAARPGRAGRLDAGVAGRDTPHDPTRP
jgi:hypothetical protein